MGKTREYHPPVAPVQWSRGSAGGKGRPSEVQALQFYLQRLTICSGVERTPSLRTVLKQWETLEESNQRAAGSSMIPTFQRT